MSGEHLRQQRRTAENSVFADRMQKALEHGDLWLHRFVDTLASGTNLNVVVHNPPENNTNLAVTRRINTSEGITGRIYESVDIDAAGTAVDYINTHHKPTPDRDVPSRVERDITYSGGFDRLPIDFPSGGQTRGGASGANFLLEPGTNALYDFTSDGSGNFVEIQFLVVELTDAVDEG